MKGLVQETVLIAVLMAGIAIFTVIVGADASGDTEQIFELLETLAMLGTALIPAIGFYYFWKAWN